MNIGKLKLKSSTPNPSGVTTHSHQPKSAVQKQEKSEIEKIFDEKLKTKDKVVTYESFVGSGMVISSGTSLNGNNDAKFKTEIENGDYIIVENPLLKTQ